MENDRERMIEAFAELIAENHFESVTPKKVTERAGVPASAFSYEFSDMYVLADAYLEAECDAVTSSGIMPETAGEAFILTASLSLRSPRGAENICRSGAAGVFKRRVSDLATRYFSHLVINRLGERKPGERERSAVRFFRAAAVGLSTKELLAAADPSALAREYADLFDLAADGII